MKTKKVSLSNLQGKLSREEMKNLLGGVDMNVGEGIGRCKLNTCGGSCYKKVKPKDILVRGTCSAQTTDKIDPKTHMIISYMTCSCV